MMYILAEEVPANPAGTARQGEERRSAMRRE
jgi:hypothetical protein